MVFGRKQIGKKTQARRFILYLVVTVLILLLGPALIGGLGSWLGARFSDLVFEREADDESEELRAALTDLMLENARLRESALKAERYRQLLGITRTASGRTLAGRVLFRREGLLSGILVVDRGAADGVVPNSICLSPGGLVGIIGSVSESTCDVLTLTNPAVTLTGVTYPSGALGLVRSSPAGRVTMVHIDLALAVSVGDRVLTSRSGGVYPDGLLIGEVTGIETGEPGMEQVLDIQTAVDFDRLDEVLILLPDSTEIQGQ